jgi:hypothetical protein
MAYRIPATLGFEAARSAPKTFDGRGYAALGAAVGELAQGVNAEFAKKDDQAAIDLLVKEQAAFEPEYRARAEAYDGKEPGFALKEGRAWENRVNLLTASIEDRGVRQALQRRGREAVRGVITHASDVEAQRRSEPARNARMAQETALLLDGDIAFNQAYNETVKPLYDGFDGTQGDLTARVLQRFDDAVEIARGRVDPRVLPQWETAMAARRAKEFANASTVEQKGQDGVVLRNVSDKGRVLINQLIDNPALYNDNVAGLDSLVATLPASMQAETARSLKAEAAKAYVQGLVANKQGEEAKTLLSGGAFDKVLDPDTKSALARFVENGGKSDFDAAMAKLEARDRALAAVDAYARGETPDVDLDELNAILGGSETADFVKRAQLAKDAGAVVRQLPEMGTAEVLALANAQPPDTEAPDYLVRKQVWETGREAAKAELAERQKDPAAWAQRSFKPGDTGAQLQERLARIGEAADARGRAAAADSYKNLVIWKQEAAGLDPANWRMLSKQQAAARVVALNSATPETRAGQLKASAAWVNAFPATARDNSGRMFSPRGMVLRELQGAGLKPMEAAAIIDFGDSPGQMDAVAAAMTFGPATVKLPDSKEETRLVEAVGREMTPYFESAAPMPGAKALQEPRLALVSTLARHLTLTQNMSPAEAAKAAAKAYTSDYIFWDGLRLPKGEKAAHAGLAEIRNKLIKDDLLLPVGSRGAATGQQGLFTGDFVKRYGRWTTNPDDGGATLMAPRGDGTWAPVLDRWGRPVAASWSDARSILGDPSKAVGPIRPPPPPPKADRLAPAVRPAAAVFDALAGAVESTETAGDPRQISPKGAKGAMQLMPGTAEAAARRLGLKYDPARLLNDHDYNRKIGREELRHQLTQWRDPVLALVAYNAGENVLKPTYVDSQGRRQVGWLARFGDPRRGEISYEDWVAKLPYKETRDYVRKTLPDAYRRLK